MIERALASRLLLETHGNTKWFTDCLKCFAEIKIRIVARWIQGIDFHQGQGRRKCMQLVLNILHAARNEAGSKT